MSWKRIGAEERSRKIRPAAVIERRRGGKSETKKKELTSSSSAAAAEKAAAAAALEEEVEAEQRDVEADVAGHLVPASSAASAAADVLCFWVFWSCR